MQCKCLGASQEAEIHIGQGGYYDASDNSHENSEKSWQYTPGISISGSTCENSLQAYKKDIGQ